MARQPADSGGAKRAVARERPILPRLRTWSGKRIHARRKVEAAAAGNPLQRPISDLYDQGPQALASYLRSLEQP
jgi:hypothetical protein